MRIKLSHVLLAVLALFVALLVALGVMVFLAVSDEAAVRTTVEFTPAHIASAKKIVAANDPRTMKSGEIRTVTLSQDELNLVLHYVASQAPGVGLDASLDERAALLMATVPLPPNPIGKYLNIQAHLEQTDKAPRCAWLELGRLSLPGFVGDWLFASLLAGLKGDQAGPDYLDLVKATTISQQGVSLTYQWDDDASRQLTAAVVPADEQARWQYFQARLTEIAANLGTGKTVSLTTLINPMVKLAQEQSANGGAVAQNRAMLVVLGAYLTGQGLDRVVPAAQKWPAPVRLKVLLGGRDDFPKHFAISAAMVASAGTSFADAVGVFKELKDSQAGGSGFSFNDIVADRAGARFGEQAVAGEDGARKFQQKVGLTLKESDIFPDVSDIPEFMPEADFKRRFGGVGQPKYEDMMTEIERRIAALRFFQ